MREVFVFGIERVVDLERAAAFRQVAGYRKVPGRVDPALEIARKTVRAGCAAEHAEVDAGRMQRDSLYAFADLAVAGALHAGGAAEEGIVSRLAIDAIAGFAGAF